MQWWLQCNAMQSNAMMTAAVSHMLSIWWYEMDGVMSSGLFCKMMLVTITVRTMMRTRTRIGGLKLLNLLQPLSHLNRYRHCHSQCHCHCHNPRHRHRQRWLIGIIIIIIRPGWWSAWGNVRWCRGRSPSGRADSSGIPNERETTSRPDFSETFPSLSTIICGDCEEDRGVLGFAWSWPNLKMRSVDEQDDSDSLLQIGMRVKLTMHCGECLKKIAAQWILCRLESGVMQATWRNHTSEDVNSQWTHPRHHYKHPHCVSFPLPMMCHESWCALKGTKYKYQISYCNLNWLGGNDDVNDDENEDEDC